MNTKLQLASNAFFVLSLLVPCGLQLVGGGGSGTSFEFRRPAEAPAPPTSLSELASYPSRFGAHFEDSLLLRRSLVRQHNRAKLALGVSPTPKLVLGKGGWIYYAGERVFEGMFGVDLLSPTELERWRRSLTSNHAWLRARGIDYLVVVCPNKASVYPEYLPDALYRERPARLEQWLGHVRDAQVPVLDLRAALRASKDAGLLYHPLGTHWTTRGAHVGYAAFVKALGRADWSPTPWSELPLEGAPGESWGTQLRLADVLVGPREEVPTALSPALANGRGGEGPRVLIFGDSFVGMWTRLVPRDVSAVAFAGWGFSREWVENFQPDVVIQQTVERNLIMKPPEEAR